MYTIKCSDLGVMDRRIRECVYGYTYILRVAICIYIYVYKYIYMNVFEYKNIHT